MDDGGSQLLGSERQRTSQVESLFESSLAVLLRLGPYSPMLNPCEASWSKIKANGKAAIGHPPVEGPALENSGSCT